MRGGNTWIDSVTHMTQGITAGVTLGPPNQLCNGPVTAASLIPSDISTVIVSLEHTLASAGYCNPRYHPLECLPYKCVAVIVLCPAQFQCDTNTHTHTLGRLVCRKLCIPSICSIRTDALDALVSALRHPLHRIFQYFTPIVIVRQPPEVRSCRFVANPI